MITEELNQQVAELNNEGYSYSEIAEELGLSNVDVPGILQSLENENEESPAQLTRVDKANQLQERKLVIEEKKLKKETVERKRTILNKFKNFCLGILDNISGSTWERAAIKKAFREIEEIEDQVQDQFEIEDEELQDNSIFEILSVLKNEFKTLTEKDPDYNELVA